MYQRLLKRQSKLAGNRKKGIRSGSLAILLLLVFWSVGFQDPKVIAPTYIILNEQVTLQNQDPRQQNGVSKPTLIDLEAAA